MLSQNTGGNSSQRKSVPGYMLSIRRRPHCNHCGQLRQGHPRSGCPNYVELTIHQQWGSGEPAPKRKTDRNVPALLPNGSVVLRSTRSRAIRPTERASVAISAPSRIVVSEGNIHVQATPQVRGGTLKLTPAPVKPCSADLPITFAAQAFAFIIGVAMALMLVSISSWSMSGSECTPYQFPFERDSPARTRL